MKTVKKNRSPGVFFAGLLAVMLALIFAKSFLPGYVHFSNDGPLGQQTAAWTHLPEAFTGTWGDLNSIGTSQGTWPLGVDAILRWMLGPVGFSKFFPPIALFLLGFGAWTFFRALNLSPLAATLGGLAVTLNSNYFSTACWGVASWEVAIGMDFFALALVASNTTETPKPVRWLRLALAGLAVGINVIEGADIGAIFSLFVALFVLVRALVDGGGSALARWTRGISSVAVVAIFAGFIAWQTVVSLVTTQIQGVVGAGQDAETKAQHWDGATQWSLPKVETLGLFMPGVFGYKMDTPNGMPDYLQDAYKGGSYWGGMGRDPVLDRFFDGGGQGQLPPHNFIRQTGGQNYAGIMVVLIAAWAVAQSLRRKDSAFEESQRKLIRFWTVVLFGGVFLAWGRFTPFDLYKHTVYAVPYFSTMRNPAKFTLLFSMAVTTLFAYGVHGLSRCHLAVAGPNSLGSQLDRWQARVPAFDRKWTWTNIVLVGASLAGWWAYASEKASLVAYLQKVGCGDEFGGGGQIASFSIGQAGWFVVFLAGAAGLCILIVLGVFGGRRAKVAGVLLAALLLLDLVRADLPYVIHWDYQEKYASNPIIDFLRDEPYEHRVKELQPPEGVRLPGYDAYFDDLYKIEWVQQLFPYYNIQSLDVVQRPRLPINEATYEMAFYPRTPDGSWLIARHWQLTNTRYLLGPAGFLDSLNEQLDPAQRRFRIVRRFDVVPKPGVMQLSQLEQMTAVPSDNGACAVFEFTGALPRVKLYSSWQVNTNDEAVLKTLTAPDFDPVKTVLVATPAPGLPAAATNASSGSVEYKSYTPADIELAAKADAPTVLLLNDKFDPNWRVSVDGRPAELLCCNFIMRGVYLPAGAHTVQFQFRPPTGSLYITVATFGVALLLGGGLLFLNRRRPGPAT